GAPNHPSYPSGHSCVSQAMADVLSDFFPSKAADLGAQVTDAGLSRMYGGIHFRSDIAAGEQLGRLTAQHALGIDKQQGLLSVLRWAGCQSRTSTRCIRVAKRGSWASGSYLGSPSR